MKEIMVDLEKCNGCMMCLQACAAEHSTSKTICGALREGTHARIFLQAVNGVPVPVLCRHCDDAPCVDACMSGAMKKDAETGLVTNEAGEQECVGCWMCIMSCPYGAIAQDYSAGTAKAIKCDRCGGQETPACVAACPNEALVLMEPDEFSAHRRQKEAKNLVKVG